MWIRVGVVEGGFKAEMAPPDGFSGEGRGGEEAGAAEEVDGELVEGTGRGYGRGLGGG